MYTDPSRRRRSILFFILLLLSIGTIFFCLKNGKPGTAFNTELPSSDTDPINNAVKRLQTGDLVLRTGNDMTSYMLTQLNQTEKIYSHCGIVIMENGYPYVYHSIGGEDNPDAKLRRDSIEKWVSPKHNLGFAAYNLGLTEDEKTALTESAHCYYMEQRMFDMKFDLATDDRLYCSEFIYKVLLEVMGSENFIGLSDQKGFKYVGIDDLYLNDHAKLICRVRYK